MGTNRGEAGNTGYAQDPGIRVSGSYDGLPDPFKDTLMVAEKVTADTGFFAPTLNNLKLLVPATGIYPYQLTPLFAQLRKYGVIDFQLLPDREGAKNMVYKVTTEGLQAGLAFALTFRAYKETTAGRRLTYQGQLPFSDMRAIVETTKEVLGDHPLGAVLKDPVEPVTPERSHARKITLERENVAPKNQVEANEGKQVMNSVFDDDEEPEVRPENAPIPAVNEVGKKLKEIDELKLRELIEKVKAHSPQTDTVSLIKAGLDRELAHVVIDIDLANQRALGQRGKTSVSQGLDHATYGEVSHALQVTRALVNQLGDGATMLMLVEKLSKLPQTGTVFERFRE